MKDPYEILGVQRTDTDAAIRAAYRKLAKRHHPDLNPGKPEEAERFKEISTANELLSDKEKRAKFDAGEIDAEGREINRQFYRDFHAGPGGAPGHERYRGASGGFTQEDVESFFSQAFHQANQGAGAGQRGGQHGRRFTARGSDAQYSLTVGFLDAANGTVRRIALPDGRTLDVRIPPGTQDGHVLRLKGQGMPGMGGGPSGDALVEISVAPHVYFRREGDDIVITLPVTLQEAVLGGTLEVPTIKGMVRLNVPPGSGTDTRLRLRGRGIREGHQFVQLNVITPPGDEPELAAFLKEWKPREPFNPRDGMEEP